MPSDLLILSLIVRSFCSVLHLLLDMLILSEDIHTPIPNFHPP